MNIKLLRNCNIESYLCPYCGSWHYYNGYRLIDESKLTLKCENDKRRFDYDYLDIDFSNNEVKIEYKFDCPVNKRREYLSFIASLCDFKESSEEPIVYFKHKLDFPRSNCNNCRHYSCKMHPQKKEFIELGFKFLQKEYDICSTVKQSRVLQQRLRELKEEISKVERELKKLEEHQQTSNTNPNTYAHFGKPKTIVKYSNPK